jgi:hypothetical protein
MKRVQLIDVRGCIQKFPVWVIMKYTLTTINTRWEATQRVMVAKLPRLTHTIAIQLHLMAESSTICSSRSRRPVQNLLGTPSHYWVQCEKSKYRDEEDIHLDFSHYSAFFPSAYSTWVEVPQIFTAHTASAWILLLYVTLQAVVVRFTGCSIPENWVGWSI